MSPEQVEALHAWVLVLARAPRADQRMIGIAAMGDVGIAPCIRCESCPLGVVMSLSAVVEHLRESSAPRHTLRVDDVLAAAA